MAMWTERAETGRLNDAGADMLLRMDGGGAWRLDVGPIVRWRSRRLLGERVRVTGFRIGFDLLAVTRVERAAAG